MNWWMLWLNFLAMIMLVVQVNACAFEKLFSKLLSVFWISLCQNHMRSDTSQYDTFNSSASRMPPAKWLKNLISPTSNLSPQKFSWYVFVYFITTITTLATCDSLACLPVFQQPQGFFCEFGSKICSVAGIY